METMSLRYIVGINNEACRGERRGDTPCRGEHVVGTLRGGCPASMSWRSGGVSWRTYVVGACRGSMWWKTYVVEACRGEQGYKLGCRREHMSWSNVVGACRGEHGYKLGCRREHMSWSDVVEACRGEQGTS